MKLVFGCDRKKKASEKVSETAKDLFYRRGIRAVGVDEIVNQAGVTKPSLYRTYSSKDDLITCCLRQHAEEARLRFEQSLAEAPDNPRRQVSLVLRAYADLAEGESFRGCPVSNAVVEFPEPDHPVHQLARELKQESRQRLLSLIRALDVKDPEGLTDSLILLLEGTASACQSYGCNGPVHAFIRTAEALIDQNSRA